MLSETEASKVIFLIYFNINYYYFHSKASLKLYLEYKGRNVYHIYRITWLPY